MKELLVFGIVIVMVWLGWAISLSMGLSGISSYVVTGMGAIIGVLAAMLVYDNL
jgi:hypothetical protein